MSPQLPPEGISQSAWDEAVGIAYDLPGSVRPHNRDFAALVIARAIDAATAAERERCAEQAILHGHKVNLRFAVDASLSSWKMQRLQSTLRTCETIAREIRAPQNDNFRTIPHMGPVA